MLELLDARIFRTGRVTSTVGLARQDEAVGDGAQRGRGQEHGLHGVGSMRDDLYSGLDNVGSCKRM